jgi:hypothetical protein
MFLVQSVIDQRCVTLVCKVRKKCKACFHKQNTVIPIISHIHNHFSWTRVKTKNAPVYDLIRCGNMAKSMVFLFAGGNAFTTFPRKRQTPRPLMTVWWDRGLLDEGQVTISITTLGRHDIQASSIITSPYDSGSQPWCHVKFVCREFLLACRQNLNFELLSHVICALVESKQYIVWIF